MAKGQQGTQGSRGAIKHMHGRSMKSSNTNHVGASASAVIRKPAKSHQVQTQRAKQVNTAIVSTMNLRSAQGNQAAVRALM